MSPDLFTETTIVLVVVAVVPPGRVELLLIDGPAHVDVRPSV